MEENLNRNELMLLGTPELAYLGDSVYELSVRERLILSGIRNSGELVRRAKDYVTAAAQADILNVLAPVLTEEESAIVNRGRNIKPKHSPKHASPRDYSYATAIECLFGYLYISGDTARLNELTDKIFTYKKVVKK